jgi:hypothetical protein
MISRLLFGIFLAVALFPSLASGNPRGAPATLSCTGLFARNVTHASLVKAFGKHNVALLSVGVGEGETVKASVIFPRDKVRRFEILWIDEKRRRNPQEIRLGIDSRLRTAQGIGLKTTLAEVETLNGRPFTLWGFGWDYGGTTTDWHDGKLGTQPGGCTLELRFIQGTQTRADVSGERSFTSDDPGIRSAAPIVDGISLKYSQ